MITEYDDEWMIRCVDCACMVPQLLDPREVGCDCAELGVHIGPDECFGPCSYFIDKNEEEKERV